MVVYVQGPKTSSPRPPYLPSLIAELGRSGRASSIVLVLDATPASELPLDVLNDIILVVGVPAVQGVECVVHNVDGVGSANPSVVESVAVKQREGGRGWASVSRVLIIARRKGEAQIKTHAM
jgi:hypothetical protein